MTLEYFKTQNNVGTYKQCFNSKTSHNKTLHIIVTKQDTHQHYNITKQHYNVTKQHNKTQNSIVIYITTLYRYKTI